MIKRTTQLRRLLTSDRTEFILEAHDGLSGKIVEEAGFAGIWGSGLSISAALGVRDANEASWTQVLDVVEFISDATTIPILLDADTGFGNFNNVRRLVRKLQQRGVAGMCIEDKLFPKTNSFVNGKPQRLIDVAEFVGKLKAAKDTQEDPDFCVVARTEAFIAGCGLTEALRRAEAYCEAGADAILVHSKHHTAAEIVAFMTEWRRPCPIVVVPTTYYRTPTSLFEELGISLVIWANHMMRACVSAMQRLAERIRADRSLHRVEDQIAPIAEILRLQDSAELKAAEQRYLPESESVDQGLLGKATVIRR